MRIYVYSKCSTCKDALRFLSENGIKAEVKEITETPPSLSELKAMLAYQDGNLKKLFNTSGIQYREMGLTDKLKSMSLQQSLELLSANGMLVKRPFLLGKDFGMLGSKVYDVTSWEGIL